jgi:hypothetical protein
MTLCNLRREILIPVFSRLLPFSWESRKRLSQLAPPRVQLTVILTSKSSKTSSTDAISSSLNGNLVCPFALIATTTTHTMRLGEFVAKTVEEDLTRLLAPPTIGAGAAEGPTVIRRQHSQLILLKLTQFS